MSPKKRRVGKYSGFLDSFSRLEMSCFPAQGRNRAAAPASSVNVDHSSTAPNANTAKIRTAHRLRTSTPRNTCGSRPGRLFNSTVRVVPRTPSDEIFNGTDPYLFLHEPEIVDPELSPNERGRRLTDDFQQ